MCVWILIEVLPASIFEVDIDKAFPFSGPTILSHPPKHIHTNTNTQTTINGNTNTNKTFCNKKLYKSYESAYSFTKKKDNRSQRGRVFFSTVQNLPQHHSGKHSNGAYIKT